MDFNVKSISFSQLLTENIHLKAGYYFQHADILEMGMGIVISVQQRWNFYKENFRVNQRLTIFMNQHRIIITFFFLNM